MLRSLTRPGAAASIALFSIAIACTPKARPTTAKEGIATKETWVALEEFGTKIKVPNGWEFKRKEAIIASFAKEGRGAWVIAGTHDGAEAKRLLSIGVHELEIEPGQSNGPPRDVVLNGITFARLDYDAARVRGKTAHLVVLAADAIPKGQGILLFIGYAHADAGVVQSELHEAIGSLSPN